MGKIQNEKFEQNLEIFRQLNQKVSILVSNLIEKIYSMLLEALKTAANEQQYNNVKFQITQKLVAPVDQSSIINQFGGESHRNSLGGLKN